MMQRTWFGRLFSRLTPARRRKPAPQPVARLALEALPVREVMSATAPDAAPPPTWVVFATSISLFDLPPGWLGNFNALGAQSFYLFDRIGSDDGRTPDPLSVTVAAVPFPTPFASPNSASPGGTGFVIGAAEPPRVPTKGFTWTEPAKVTTTPTPPTPEHAAATTPAAPVGPAEAAPARPPVRPDTPVFRICGTPRFGQRVAVPYTLTAHGPQGTVSVSGAATLTPAATAVAVTPGPTAARGPDVLTLTLQPHPDVRPVCGSATLFLTPAPRVHDAVLFDAHRVGRSAEAFGELVRRHEAAVGRVCRGVVRAPADAEDVSQVVFLKLARRQVGFDDPLAGWLRAVAWNSGLMFLRAKRRRRRHEQASAKPVAVDSPLFDLGDDLAWALEQLPPELRQAVRLRYLDGYTQHEAARIAGVPRGTLSRRAADGLRRLRELLADPEFD
jgi:RNA polymerase sigma-70 factor (ECF subfamily)